ncbi:uncharacterized protein VICG_00502 [Vittaforma corneae ATCC 50505]|uniref:ATP-dependent (S)-NAD(P)H-hydrate dehydratase n=1 Tax=Vittaforma corneae (strain ATCC 50505) TaxID=993615 RepID=L2GNC7_VITCO|nr:uncharacterized protein VICG_00502 [Vittaforma corneae ATCC 50505]ELA42403.1 hypothetical protein VICG_00502 [Vittaforma corneae ATCC 50505]
MYEERVAFKGKTFHKLKRNAAKGENGCIILIGGSRIYTGAPIFTALGAMRSGSDLVYIFTASEAIDAIKQIPEVIVLPFEMNCRILDKATACVVGPGLGRPAEDEISQILKILDYLDSRNIPFVLDADAIHYYKTGIFAHLKNVILTPNYKEAMGLEVLDHHICIYKGKADVIETKSRKLEINSPSSLKRCGGQGDILSGILATALSLNGADMVDASLSSCELLRTSTSFAFKKHGFSLITSDIFDEIRIALLELLNDSI